jgi:hypothetical protein
MGRSSLQLGLVAQDRVQLTYAHFPPITIGYVAFVLGGSSILLGRAEARTPGCAEMAVMPARLTAFFLWFINSSHHFWEQMDSYGALGVALGPGYWLMMIGTVVVEWGVVRRTWAGVLQDVRAAEAGQRLVGLPSQNREDLGWALRLLEREP